MASDHPVYATSPITYLSTLRSDVAETRDAHFFKVWSSIEATLRLGGISAPEFKAVLNSDHAGAAAWTTEQLKNCHNAHSLCSDLKVSDQLPTRLLSLSTPGVVKVINGSMFDHHVPYVALSYCWGGDQEVKLTTASESTLREGVATASLSKTIQDSVEFCRQLSMDHLWVDALCIMQNGDNTDWNREASNIQRIYGNAHMTLSICSSASASDGFIREDDGLSLPVDPVWSDLYGMLPIPVRKTLVQMRTETPLASRGWIFQEELLSPRIIYWSDHGLFWSCSEHKDAENGTANGGDALFPHLTMPEVMDPHEFRRSPDPLFLWDDMISAFSTRDFTVQSDRLPAVAGLAALIEQSTGEEYLMGLWRSRLPAQLLWTVVDAPKEIQSSASRNSMHEIQIPSWSWASIEPGRKIVMPKQASVRARLCEDSSSEELHLCGRMRSMTKGLGHFFEFPQEVHAGAAGPRFPDLQQQANIWVEDEDSCRVLLCLDWRRPIIINLDNGVPASFEDLVCFEVNYIGLLLLQPVSAEGRQVYRRIGCAQTHRESGFFDTAEQVDIVLV